MDMRIFAIVLLFYYLKIWSLDEFKIVLNSIYIAPNYFHVFLIIKFVQLSYNAQDKILCINCYNVQLTKINNLFKIKAWLLPYREKLSLYD
jgi:hypothetical protein